MSRLFTPSSPGDAFDVVMLLGKHVFEWRHFPLLTQLVVISLLTAVMTLAGPIARFALRSGQMVRQTDLHGLNAVRGAGPLGNRVSAQVIWNDTIQSLDRAGFPRNQLMDFLPSTTDPWVYRAEEWQPTWEATCTDSEEKPLNLTGNVDYTMTDALDALPEFRATVNPLLLDSSLYRATVDWCGWLDWSLAKPIKDFVMFVMLQSDPVVDDQMDKNQNPLTVSISAIRIHDADMVANYGGFSGRAGWRINGTIGNASYTRVECTFTRKTHVDNELMVPWPWTNDTASIAMGFADYYRQYVGVKSANDAPIPLPSSDDLLRFYQVYIAVMSTGIVTPAVKVLSLTYETVELSSVFLAFMLLFTLLIVVGTIRYTLFYHRNKKQLEELFVPDAKLDWMVHVSKVGENLTEAEIGMPNRDHFQSATFGRETVDMSVGRLGRVQTMSLSSVNLKQSSPFSIGTMMDPKGLQVTVGDCSMSHISANSNITRTASTDLAPDEPGPSRSTSITETTNANEKGNANGAIHPA